MLSFGKSWDLQYNCEGYMALALVAWETLSSRLRGYCELGIGQPLSCCALLWKRPFIGRGVPISDDPAALPG